MKSKRLKSGILLIILALLLVLSLSVRQWETTAFADTAVYTNTDVLSDLQKDSSFKSSDYPEKANDYSIKVIQIAESENGKLYLYTYQPSGTKTPVVATDINMSLLETVEGTRLYSLILVNTNGVFAKYLVKDITVSNKSTRYYNITSIYRKWDEKLDGKLTTNNEGAQKAYPVRNVYKVTTVDGEKQYTCAATIAVNIKNPYSDFLLYTEYKSLPAISSMRQSFEKFGLMDAHYIAFSTDWEIDRLTRATVVYTARAGHGIITGFSLPIIGDVGKDGEVEYGDEKEAYAYPTYKDKASVTGSSWTGRKYNYTWDRIQTAAEFISTEPKLTDETKQNLHGQQWVLRFVETKRTQTERTILGYKKTVVDWTEVKEVSVLRLEFETDGKVYDIGAVSDAVSGDNRPGNAEEKQDDFWDNVGQWFEKLWDKITGIKWWVWLLIVVGIIAAISLVISFIKFGIKAIIQGIWWLIKSLILGIWTIISFPFRLIARLFKRGDD